jgi:hypothetical protein
MQNHHAVLSTFQFKRNAETIQVYNENSYLMAEYNVGTGIVKWQRVLIATHREVIERWLRERYPSLAAAAAAGRNSAAPQVATPPPVATPSPRVHRPRPASGRGSSRRTASK